MAVTLPDPLKRREILYGTDTPKETLVEYGAAYEEQGRIDDAMQFYSQAGDEAGLKRIKTKAFDVGDAFLLKGVARALPELVSEDDWKQMVSVAEKLGKDQYAEQARAALEGHLEALEPEEKRGQGKA